MGISWGGYWGFIWNRWYLKPWNESGTLREKGRIEQSSRPEFWSTPCSEFGKIKKSQHRRLKRSEHETGSEARVASQEPSEESLPIRRKWITVWNITDILSKMRTKTWPRFSSVGGIVVLDKNSVRTGEYAYYIAHGTLLNVMCQPGWEESLRENGYYVYVWLSSCTIHLKLSQPC